MIITNTELQKLDFIGENQKVTYKTQYIKAEEQIQKLYMDYVNASVENKIPKLRKISKQIFIFRELQEMIIFIAKRSW